MKLARYQFLPPLTPDEYASLRESIATFGVLQPVIVDVWMWPPDELLTLLCEEVRVTREPPPA